MSLILDALKKMEQERKARQGGGIDIRPEVLGRPAPEPQRRPWGKPAILVVAGIAILGAGVGAGIALKKETPDKSAYTSLSQVRNGARAVGEEAAVPIVPPSPPPEPEETPPAPAPPKPAPLPAPVAVPPPVPTPVQRPSVAEQPTDSGYPGAGLIVSGIAWQEERSLRRAVVNGNLVGEGAEVAGARVVEIGERRVKFSQGGRTISISLSSPFPGR